jgi:hypothetical protein
MALPGATTYFSPTGQAAPTQLRKHLKKRIANRLIANKNQAMAAADVVFSVNRLIAKR